MRKLLPEATTFPTNIAYSVFRLCDQVTIIVLIPNSLTLTSNPKPNY